MVNFNEKTAFYLKFRIYENFKKKEMVKKWFLRKWNKLLKLKLRYEPKSK